jgi:hypothetical protein
VFPWYLIIFMGQASFYSPLPSDPSLTAHTLLSCFPTHSLHWALLFLFFARCLRPLQTLSSLCPLTSWILVIIYTSFWSTNCCVVPMLLVCFLHTLFSTIKYTEVDAFGLIRLSAPWGQGPYLLICVIPVRHTYICEEPNECLNECML